MYKKKMLGTKRVKMYVKNNRSKWTVLFIHGFASSNEFASNLYKLKNKYNIVSLDLYNQKKEEKVSFEDMVSIATKGLKKINSKNIIIFGHSLGGGIISKIYNKSSRVKKIVWMSTINPMMTSDLVFKTLKNHHDDDGWKIVSKLTNTLQSGINKNSNEVGKLKWISKFLDKDSPWADVMNDTIFNNSFMNNLDNVYKKTNKYSMHIIGAGDNVVNTKTYSKYVKGIGSIPLKIGKGHNPLKSNPELINDVLNDVTKAKTGKRFLPVLKFW